MNSHPPAATPSSASPVIAVTTGEPSGVGPELCVELAARRPWPARLVLLGDRELLSARAQRLGRHIGLRDYSDGALERGTLPGIVEVAHHPLSVPSLPGRLDPANSRYVVGLLERAIAGCISGEFAAMVTAPVHKAVINDAGIAFTGHTEYLAEKTGTRRVVMLLTGGGLRVALATTHLALKDVPRAITRENLEQTLRIVVAELRAKFGIREPRVLVAGLNPHAGEGGHLGREEIEVIAPVIELLCSEGLKLAGPFPADTLFTPQMLARGDCVLAMYHDQGLPVLKHVGFGHGVNVTLGLPIIRTSVDHGTALELAGTGKADSGSLLAAVETALEMVSTRASA